MCITPYRLPDRTLVACRGCWACRENRVNDWIGRALCEQQSASVCVAVTLTYRGEGPETALLRYSDVQLFLKRLRKAGYSVRYIVAGEYGSLKGRAHWHLILFFEGSAPEWEYERRFNWRFWPLGYSYFQRPDFKGFAYILKYILKDQSQTGQALQFAMSKKPPIGHEYLTGLASRIAERGFALRDPSYSFASVLDRNGVPRRFWVQGRMLEIFLASYCERWDHFHGGEPPMTDYLVERHYDRVVRAENERRAAKALFLASSPEPRVASRWLMFPSYLCDGMASAYTDGTTDVDVEGQRCLLSASVSGGNAAKQLRMIGLPVRLLQPVLSLHFDAHNVPVPLLP